MKNDTINIITDFSKIMGGYLVKEDGTAGSNEGFKVLGGFGDYLPIVYNDYLNLHVSKPEQSFSVGGEETITIGSNKVFLNMTDVVLKTKMPRELTKNYKPLVVEEFEPFKGSIGILEIITLDLPFKDIEDCKDYYKSCIESLTSEEDDEYVLDKYIQTYNSAITILDMNSNTELAKSREIKIFRILIVPFTGDQLFIDEYKLTVGGEGDRVMSFKDSESVDLLGYSFLGPSEEEIEERRKAEELIQILEKYLYNRSIHGLLSDPVARTFNIVTYFDSYSDLLNPITRASGTQGYISIEDFLEGTYNLSMFEVIRSMIQKLQGRVFKKFMLEDIVSFIEFLEFYLKERTDVDEE